MERRASIKESGGAGGTCPCVDPVGPAMPCRYWLVDDDALYRELQRELLGHFPNLWCTGSYGSADAALAELASAAPPDLILMDLNMPGTNGIKAIPLVRALAPRVRILVLSTFTNMLDDELALRAGASGFLRKTCTCEELLSAIQAVIRQPVPLATDAASCAVPLTALRQSWLQTLQTRWVGIFGL